jgi:hypothetical protein
VLDAGSITFRSDDGRAVIVLAYDAFDSDFGHIVIDGRDDGIRCDHGALSLRGDGLALFLRRLVADWAGWDGTRRWDTAGPELSIEASHHGRTVELLFIVRRDGEPDAWQLRFPVYLDPGEPLSRLAKASAEVIASW